MYQPAARLGDLHTCPKVNFNGVPHFGGPITAGCTQVLIGGQPAACVQDPAACVGPEDKIEMGSTFVMIYGRAAARVGDKTEHNGVVSKGCNIVLIA
jgi:uncharacterized Zn-binding protein involved in type VI secretion